MDGISRRLVFGLLFALSCGMFLTLGGYVEMRMGILATFEREWAPSPHPPTEPFTAGGDPGIVQRSREQMPQLSRPNLTDAGALQRWQVSLRNTLRRDLFKWTERASTQKIEYQIRSEKKIEAGITRTFLEYESFDGTHIPAYLLIPPVTGPLPTIIVLHGHLSLDSAEGISQTAGIVDSYHNRVGLHLAKAGYLVFVLEFRGFGYLGARVGAEHEIVAYNAILSGTFYKAILAKDIRSAVDLLEGMKIVNTQRIGITGVSFGGEMAVTYAALDERMKVCVIQGFGGAVGPQLPADSGQEERPHYCHLIPAHNIYLFQEDWFLLIAPHPLLGIRGDQDGTWEARFRDPITQAYARLGSPSSFQLEIANGGHEYFVLPAVQFFRLHL